MPPRYNRSYSRKRPTTKTRARYTPKKKMYAARKTYSRPMTYTRKRSYPTGYSRSGFSDVRGRPEMTGVSMGRSFERSVSKHYFKNLAADLNAVKDDITNGSMGGVGVNAGGDIVIEVEKQGAIPTVMEGMYVNIGNAESARLDMDTRVKQARAAFVSAGGDPNVQPSDFKIDRDEDPELPHHADKRRAIQYIGVNTAGVIADEKSLVGSRMRETLKDRFEPYGRTLRNKK